MNKNNLINQIHVGLYNRDISNKEEMVKTIGIIIFGILFFIGQIWFFKDSIFSSIKEMDLLNFNELKRVYEDVKRSNSTNSDRIAMILIGSSVIFMVCSIVWMIIIKYFLLLKETIQNTNNRMKSILILTIAPSVILLGTVTLIPWKFQIGFFGWFFIGLIVLLVQFWNILMNKMKEKPIIIKDNIAKDVLNKFNKK
jgi:hypothetical protein